MARINLLPWRDERRRELKQKFFASSGIAAGTTLAVVAMIHVLYSNQIDYQGSRNSFLEAEIRRVDQTIAEIKDLEQQKQRLIDRMQAIETLQTSRPVIVHLFDELVTRLPEGISLTEITQANAQITIKGIAESNARVSNFMRNVESSRWLKDPRLDVIETKLEDGRRINNFTLVVQQATEESQNNGAVAGGPTP